MGNCCPESNLTHKGQYLLPIPFENITKPEIFVDAFKGVYRGDVAAIFSTSLLSFYLMMTDKIQNAKFNQIKQLTCDESCYDKTHGYKTNWCQLKSMTNKNQKKKRYVKGKQITTIVINLLVHIFVVFMLILQERTHLVCS